MVLVFKDNSRINLTDKESENLAKVLENGSNQGFIRLRGFFYNLYEIKALVDEIEAEHMNHTHNGEWICNFNRWHDRFSGCDCYWGKSTDLGPYRFSTTGRLVMGMNDNAIENAPEYARPYNTDTRGIITPADYNKIVKKI